MGVGARQARVWVWFAAHPDEAARVARARSHSAVVVESIIRSFSGEAAPVTTKAEDKAAEEKCVARVRRWCRASPSPAGVGCSKNRRRKAEREKRLLEIGNRVPFTRIWRMSSPELLYVLLASLGATVRSAIAWARRRGLWVTLCARGVRRRRSTASRCPFFRSSSQK